MKAINCECVKILGAILLGISGPDSYGNILETAQICYVTNETDKFYLSRETCIGLSLISEQFPSIGEVASSSIVCVPNEHYLSQTKVPFPATEEYRKDIRKWIIKYYSSSTFNVCEHQQLPLMEGPPLMLNIDHDAPPVAIHTPIPVPLHWQEEVKAGLDRDVRIGVLKPVHVGNPVTWCHRMVTCKKKNGNL